MNLTLISAAFSPIDWILGIFGKVLAFFDSITGSYLIAIFIFAVLAKIILFPFAIRQQKNTLKQAGLRPKEQAVRKKYQGRTDQATQTKMQQEIMDLYQSEGYSPYGGCLPMLIQLPIILGLYEIIRNPLRYTMGLETSLIDNIKNTISFLGTSVLKGVDHLFKDGIFSGSSGLDFMSVLKNEENFNAVAQRLTALRETVSFKDLPNFNFLGLDLSFTPMNVFSDWSLWYYLLIPVLTFVTMYFSMKLTKKLTYQPDPAMSGGMPSKIMDFAMPLLSTWFAFMLPSMLGIYWMFNNLLGILQSFILSKMFPVPTFTEEDYKAAERELKGKKPKTVAEDTRVVAGKTYKSLHHIDDEDYDEKGNYIGTPEPEPEEPAPQRDAAPNENAPRLKEDAPHKPKNKKGKK